MTDAHWQKFGPRRYRKHRRSLSTGAAAPLFAEGGPLYKSVVEGSGGSSSSNSSSVGDGDGDGGDTHPVVNRAEDIMALHTPRITSEELKTTSQPDQEE